MRVEIYGDAKQETVSGPTVQFTADDAAPVTDLKAQITPSIAGHSSVTISANGQNTNVSLTKSVYGGSADITTGVVTETHGGGAYNPTAVPSDLSSKIVSATTARSASGSVASFNCSLGEYPMDALTAAINPVQDLHGYDHPWPGGSGKNKLRLPTIGATINGVTFTVNTDGTITANGTATANADFYFVGGSGVYADAGVASGDYKANGISSVGSTCAMFVAENGKAAQSIANGNETSISIDSTKSYRIFVRVSNGATVNNLTLYPMIRLASDTDATFAPYSNICPISGWSAVGIDVTGKNLLDLSAFAARATARRCRLRVNQDNTLTVTCTESGQVWAGTAQSVGGNLSNDYTIPVNGGETIVLSTSFAVASFAVVEANAEKTVTRYNTTTGAVTLREDTRFVAFRLIVSNSMTAGDSVTGTFQVEHGSQPTAFKPYEGNQYTITFPTAAGTVYGGTLDVVNGVLTVDRAGVDLGTLTWESRYTGSTNKTILSHLPSMLPHRQQRIVLAENYQYFGAVGATTQLSNPDNLAVGLRTYYMAKFAEFDNLIYAVLPISDNPAGSVVYPLATPVTYTLTPQDIATILGQNNVWADTGDVTVSYRDGLLSNVSGIMTNSTALTTGENITYTLSQERTFQIPGTVIRTVVGNNVMSASTGNISVTWSSHWFDITPWIAYQGLTFSRNDVDAPDAGRDMSGYMHRGRVGVKEKMNVQTVQLTRAQSSFLQTLLYPETIQVRVTPYPRTNGAYTMSMYTNNVKTTYVIHRKNGEDLQSLTFPLIEN